jgi:hypothetical protein
MEDLDVLEDREPQLVRRGPGAGSTAANNGETRVVRQDGTPSSVQAGDMSETSLFVRGGIVAPPAAGWTLTELDALKARVGYSMSRTTECCRLMTSEKCRSLPRAIGRLTASQAWRSALTASALHVR